jgi:hypothetical protein
LRESRSRLRTARGSIAITTTTQRRNRRHVHSMMGMEILDTTNMEAMDTTTMEEMAATIMATRVTTTTTLEGVMTKTATVTSHRGILARWNASVARRLGIIQETALRRTRMTGTSQTHSRRGMLIMSMWRKFMMNLMQ